MARSAASEQETATRPPAASSQRQGGASLHHVWVSWWWAAMGNSRQRWMPRQTPSWQDLRGGAGRASTAGRPATLKPESSLLLAQLLLFPLVFIHQSPTIRNIQYPCPTHSIRLFRSLLRPSPRPTRSFFPASACQPACLPAALTPCTPVTKPSRQRPSRFLYGNTSLACLRRAFPLPRFLHLRQSLISSAPDLITVAPNQDFPRSDCVYGHVLHSTTSTTTSQGRSLFLPEVQNKQD
ncbi:hypothetical protein B0T19DRAFT_140976 [Cercophora scortea]|uniref:Uncharacterized protein n=1 Tax=Cercophora scortea TaxID=314031 RepID=A0AAE0IZ14_9PEZI|nr:hypothetical protein B0T19DRAFT_140976 [Cercophora scortea]